MATDCNQSACARFAQPISTMNNRGIFTVPLYLLTAEDIPNKHGQQLPHTRASGKPKTQSLLSCTPNKSSTPPTLAHGSNTRLGDMIGYGIRPNPNDRTYPLLIPFYYNIYYYCVLTREA
ncbi:hypothetical protein Hanom_Chr14g01274441 [Helianthus anomalus]